MKFLSILFASFLLFSASATAQISTERVPAIFTGNSPAPAYKNYRRYRTKVDTRDSREFAEYYLNTKKVNDVRANEGIRSVHTHVRNIARDGLCSSAQCFRVFVYLNGNENDGHHVATFVVSPGTGRRTPTDSDRRLRTHTRTLTKFERPTQFKKFDMYRIYGSKSYPGKIPNMPNAMFYRSAIALHGSFDTVDGNKRSHGCVRMFPDESYFLHGLVREANGRMTVDVLHTR